ncbi:alpha/beta fold hydrolase [Brachybacterium phenoliresistens]|uniref:Alpha/beta hydrolase n=1 Tax=Brachybacterium phenoliresistens TaxID=396014 RepID=Z9JYF3_9MICO|nr:alpha/beta hydrolase [Brachybacterium phenoliresistens]EWS82827.1 alpha/beta hydrolase [Brachybacterium phenoliresistens]
MTHPPAEHAVVLLHGWPVTPAHWRGLLPALRRAGFAPLPVTLPGLGAAPGDTPDLRKSALARGLQEKLAGLGHARFAVIGHDWGGSVAALLAAAMPEAVSALVIEEEILPGVEVDIPAPGADHYPTWHGPFNRVPGLAEQLVPGREEAYYGSFLTQSAGPAGLEPEIHRTYVDAYRTEGVLAAGLGYYRTRSGDLADVGQLRRDPISTPVLAIGGRYAMGSAVADGLRTVATDVRGLVLEQSGHYPVEQEPETAARAIVEFLSTCGRGETPISGTRHAP